MKYIGLISDTHGVFSEAVRQFLEPVDEIWHAGDIGGGLGTMQEIAAFKPLVAVYGNADDQAVRFDCPEYQSFIREGVSVLMIHIGGYPGKYSAKARALIEKHRPTVFVCGHSHILRVMHDQKYDMLVMNPGACGQQGFHLLRTALRFKLHDGHITDLEVLKLPR